MMKKYGEYDSGFIFLTKIFMQNFSLKLGGISDEKLYELCQTYGERARLWRQKFAGLLPEVFKRELHKKKGFGSIYEFAAKLAGMSEKQVDIVLHLEKKFEDRPILKQMLEQGEVSVNKLVRVASISTAENEDFWAAQVKFLPKAALETLVRDEKYAAASFTGSDLQENNFIEKLMPGHHGNGKLTIPQELNLSAEVSQKLLELQQKGIDLNALLIEFLKKRDLDIAQKKEKLSAEAKPTNSHYIFTEVRAVLDEEHGEKCSIKTCSKPAEHIYHEQRFALAKIHDPKYLAPLCSPLARFDALASCKEHHQIAHSIDLKYQEKVAR